MWRRRPLALLGAAVLLGAFPSAASAAAGDLDPSFAGDGIAIDSSTGGARSVVIDSSGRIVVLCGEVVLRFRPSGKLDKTFSGDGRARVPFDGAAASIATDRQDRVVVVGTASPAGTHRRTFAIARLKANGGPDPSFSGDGKAVTPIGGIGTDYGRGVAIDQQGRIVAAGISYKSGIATFGVARYLANGSPDTSFSGNGQTQTQFPATRGTSGEAVAIDSKGRIVVAGETNGPTSDDFAVARYTPAGNLDPSFSGDGMQTTAMTAPGDYADARAVAIDDLDRIVVGGDREVGDFALARYRPNGALDTTFSGDGKAFTSFGRDFNIAYGVAIDDQQRIVAAGSTWNDDNSRSAFALARFTPGGALDPGFSGDGRVTTAAGSDSWCFGLALDSQGRMLAAGSANGHAVVARYLGG